MVIIPTVSICNLFLIPTNRVCAIFLLRLTCILPCIYLMVGVGVLLCRDWLGYHLMITSFMPAKSGSSVTSNPLSLNSLTVSCCNSLRYRLFCDLLAASLMRFSICCSMVAVSCLASLAVIMVVLVSYQCVDYEQTKHNRNDKRCWHWLLWLNGRTCRCRWRFRTGYAFQGFFLFLQIRSAIGLRGDAVVGFRVVS